MPLSKDELSAPSNLIGGRPALLRRCGCGALLHKFGLGEAVTCEGCGDVWDAAVLDRMTQ